MKVKNRNIRKRCGIISKLTIITQKRRFFYLTRIYQYIDKIEHLTCSNLPYPGNWSEKMTFSGVFIVNCRHIPYLYLFFLLFTLNAFSG